MQAAANCGRPAGRVAAVRRGGSLMRTASLAGFLFAFWLMLSGHYTLFLITAGAGAAVLSVYVAIRARILDADGHPIHLALGTFTYYPWLVREIVKSGWAVTRIILNPKLPVSPTMVVVKATQRTSAGIVTYANSITLTPGTITVSLEGHNLTVHALERESALDLEKGEMDRRVTQFEGTA
jgi:multicomponent Na+:H+ antiporter subunit E